MRLSTLVIIALITALTMSIWQQNQGVSMDHLRDNDPDLKFAVDKAIHNDNDDLLYAWLAEQSDFERQIYYEAAFKMALGENPESLSEIEQSQKTYEHRFLFTPFMRIGTGNPRLDRSIDNMLAYALVVGPKQEDERKAAEATIKTLITSLSKNTSNAGSPEIEDTIGCGYFVLGKYQQSLEYFKKAKSNIDKARLNDKDKKKFEKLLDKRIKAAKEEATELPLE